jgi:hypothetical protein
MKTKDTPKPTEKLAEPRIVELEPSRGNSTGAPPAQTGEPFVLRARILLIGRETLQRSKGKLHFVLITSDISETNRAEVLANFSHYPIVQHYTRTDLERFFNTKGAKAIGFAKSGLAQSIYAELKGYRINRPATPVTQATRTPALPTARTDVRRFPRRREPQPPRRGVQRYSSSARTPQSSGK